VRLSSFNSVDAPAEVVGSRALTCAPSCRSVTVLRRADRIDWLRLPVCRVSLPLLSVVVFVRVVSLPGSFLPPGLAGPNSRQGTASERASKSGERGRHATGEQPASMTSASPSLLSQREPSLTESHSLALSSPSDTAGRVAPRVTGSCINSVCRVACCCLRCGPTKPLFTAFQYVPLWRKVWWLWLCLLQLAAIPYYHQPLGMVILSAWGGTLFFSVTWAIRAGGFHRGISLVSLLFHIPLAVYLCMRLGGLDQEDFDNSSLKNDGLLWAYAIVEVITVGCGCVASFVDVLNWLLGRRRIWGHAVLSPTSPSLGSEYVRSTGARTRRARERAKLAGEGDTNGRGGDPPGTRSGLSSGQSSVAPSPAYTPALSPRFGLSSDRLSNSSSMDFDSESSLAAQLHMLSQPSSNGVLSGLTESDDSWTPRRRTEHLLNRAQEDMREQAQMEERARMKMLEQQQRRQSASQKERLALLQAAAMPNAQAPREL
jgi:hypothetical protein